MAMMMMVMMTMDGVFSHVLGPPGVAMPLSPGFSWFHLRQLGQLGSTPLVLTHRRGASCSASSGMCGISIIKTPNCSHSVSFSGLEPYSVTWITHSVLRVNFASQIGSLGCWCQLGFLLLCRLRVWTQASSSSHSFFSDWFFNLYPTWVFFASSFQ